MITTVTSSHTITIPEDISRQFGIQPGWRLDWSPIEGRSEILVRVIPGRGELARRLLGAGQGFAPERDSIAEWIAEREAEN
jgi:bifunctional DNA-binding transcriptional regulator/antitoxin component of YhaV-PrlF toxin-antitoxin module